MAKNYIGISENGKHQVRRDLMKDVSSELGAFYWRGDLPDASDWDNINVKTYPSIDVWFIVSLIGHLKYPTEAHNPNEPGGFLRREILNEETQTQFFVANGRSIHQRQKKNNVWTSWTRLWTSDDFDPRGFLTATTWETNRVAMFTGENSIGVTPMYVKEDRVGVGMVPESADSALQVNGQAAALDAFLNTQLVTLKQLVDVAVTIPVNFDYLYPTFQQVTAQLQILQDYISNYFLLKANADALYVPLSKAFEINDINGLSFALEQSINKQIFQSGMEGDLLATDDDKNPIFLDMSGIDLLIKRLPDAKVDVPYSYVIPKSLFKWPDNAKLKFITIVYEEDWPTLNFRSLDPEDVAIGGTPGPDDENCSFLVNFEWKLTPRGRKYTEQRTILLRVIADEVEVDEPDTPDNFTATAVNARRIDLAWDDLDDEAVYELYRSEDGGVTWGSVLAVLPANTMAYPDTSVEPDTDYVYHLYGKNSGGTTVTPAEAEASTPPEGVGVTGGLRARYFPSLTQKVPILERTDTTVNFSWPDGTGPDASMPATNWWGLWSGYVKTPTTANYEFRIGNDDGVRLYFGGILAVDDWNSHPFTYNPFNKAMTANVQVPIAIEFYQGTGASGLKFEWKNGSTWEHVPSSWLIPDSDLGRQMVPPVLTVTKNGKNVDLNWTFGFNPTDFEIQYKKGAAGTFAQLTTAAGSLRTKSHSDPGAGDHFYRVRPRLAGRPGEWSDVKNVSIAESANLVALNFQNSTWLAMLPTGPTIAFDMKLNETTVTGPNDLEWSFYSEDIWRPVKLRQVAGSKYYLYYTPETLPIPLQFGQAYDIKFRLKSGNTLNTSAESDGYNVTMRSMPTKFCGWGVPGWVIRSVTASGSGGLYDVEFDSANVASFIWQVLQGVEVKKEGVVYPQSGKISVDLSGIAAGDYVFFGFSDLCTGTAQKSFTIVSGGGRPPETTTKLVITDLRPTNTGSTVWDDFRQVQFWARYDGVIIPDSTYLNWTIDGTNWLQCGKLIEHLTHNQAADPTYTSPDLGKILQKGVTYNIKFRYRPTPSAAWEESAWSTFTMGSDVESVVDWKKILLRVQLSNGSGNYAVVVKLGSTQVHSSTVTYGTGYLQFDFNTFFNGQDLRGKLLTIALTKSGATTTIDYFVPKLVFKEYTPDYNSSFTDMNYRDKVMQLRLTSNFAGQRLIEDFGEDRGYNEEYYINGSCGDNIAILPNINYAVEKQYEIMKNLLPKNKDRNSDYEIGWNYEVAALDFWIQIRPWAQMSLTARRTLWENEGPVGKPLMLRDTVGFSLPPTKKYNRAFSGTLDGVTKAELDRVGWSHQNENLPMWLYVGEIVGIMQGIGASPLPGGSGGIHNWPIGGTKMTQFADAIVAKLNSHGRRIAITDWEPSDGSASVYSWMWSNTNAGDAVEWIQNYCATKGKEFYEWHQGTAFSYGGKIYTYVSREGSFYADTRSTGGIIPELTVTCDNWIALFSNLPAVTAVFPHLAFARAGGLGYNNVTKYVEKSYNKPASKKYHAVPFILFSQMVSNLFSLVLPGCKLFAVNWPTEDQLERRPNYLHRFKPAAGMQGYVRGRDIRYVYSYTLIRDYYLFCFLSRNVGMLHMWNTNDNVDPYSALYYCKYNEQTKCAEYPGVYNYEGDDNYSCPYPAQSYTGMEVKMYDAQMDAGEIFDTKYADICDGINNQLDLANAFQYKRQGQNSWTSVAASGGAEHALAWKHDQPWMTIQKNSITGKRVVMFQDPFTVFDTEFKFTINGTEYTKKTIANEMWHDRFD